MKTTSSYKNTELKGLTFKYSFCEVRNASIVLQAACPAEWEEFVQILKSFSFSANTLLRKGGSKSHLVETLENIFYKNGWLETRIDTEEILYILPKKGRLKKGKQVLKLSGEDKDFLLTSTVSSQQTAERIELLTKDFPDATVTSTYQEGYLIDCLKGRMAVDIEWNAKDGNLDRDISAYRAWYQFGLIDGAVLITKDLESCRKLINDIWEEYREYASLSPGDRPPVDLGTSTTTSSEKAVERIKRGDGGGCPILIVGIRRGCWDESQYRPD
ncbi:BglII/BstYI family type II restriction endonuclease [Parasutterella excrementihominis]|uniref:BglII/BstYI family type II restriction endonuclease n=1 Tax=Parasutterella excrementihominis TaxID=487175 RepID=UPI00242E57E0|nr:BglII/BstYI family type II restriction endonuclease [Parasutterella excrementihominis]